MKQIQIITKINGTINGIIFAFIFYGSLPSIW